MSKPHEVLAVDDFSTLRRIVKNLLPDPGRDVAARALDRCTPLPRLPAS
jgi:hypothetical protein